MAKMPPCRLEPVAKLGKGRPPFQKMQNDFIGLDEDLTAFNFCVCLFEAHPSETFFHPSKVLQKAAFSYHP